MGWKLFLDDVRENDEGTVRVENVPKAVYLIEEKGFPEFISFDNDLGEHQLEGQDFVNIIIDNVLNKKWVIPQNFTFEVHSDNLPANENIRCKMNNFLKHCGINFELKNSKPYSMR